MAGADAVVRVDFVANTRGLQKGAREAQSATSKLGGTLKTLGKAGAIAGAALVAVEFKRSIEAASDLAESMNAVNVVFGDSAQIVNDFAEGAAKNAGLSMAEANKLIVPLGAGLQNFGFSAQEAASASVELAQRAADMASVLNTDVPSALEAIQSGLRGEGDPLEKYGVSLSAAKVNAKALAMGLADTTGALTDQDKATARVALIMQQTDKYAGDFKNTSGSLANQQRILTAELTNVEAQIGQRLLPVIVDLIAFIRENWPQISAVISAAWDIVRPLLEALAALVVQVVSTIRSNWGTLGPIVMSVVAIIRAQFAVLRQVILLVTALLRGDWSAAWTAAVGLVKAQIAVLRAIVQAGMELVKAVLRAAWSAIQAGTSAAWSVITGAVRSAVDKVGEVIDKIAGKIRAVVGDVKRAAGSVADAITAPINGVISAWNNLAFTVPSFTVGGQKFGPIDVPRHTFGGQTFPFPDLPHLAAGGVLDRATLFVGGEAGREIVTPERLLRQILRDEDAGASYTLNLTTQRADAQDIAWGFRRLELLRTGR